MIKIQNTNNNIVTKEKSARAELKRHYTISVLKKGKGYEARATLKVIGGGKNPRITAYSGNSQNEAVYKILLKISDRLLEYQNMNILKREVCINIYDAILISIKELQMTTDPNIMSSVTTILKILKIQDNTANPPTTFTQIDIQQHPNNKNVTAQFYANNIKQINTTVDKQNNLDFFQQNQIKPIKSKSFEESALEWFKHKLSFTKKTVENPNPLSPKTLQGYNDIMNTQLIPYFKSNENISLISEEQIKKCINSFNGSRNKESVYIVLKMIFEFARENNWIFYVPKIQKPPKENKEKEETIIFIESDRQDIWLDLFEKENKDVTLLFETMLLTGLRPEEACGLKWCAIDEKNDELIINNAYKDFPIYNAECKVIGHKRADGTLKTPESYRRIPLNPRLKRRLLEHKEKQKELFKEYNMNWDENSYMFLNQYRKPFIPENLSGAMRNFIAKYNLETMTPYGLRHSFATFCSEQGMDEVVLMRLMGHSDFNTTQKYYICVSSKRKKQAMAEVYKAIFEKEYRYEKAS